MSDAGSIAARRALDRCLVAWDLAPDGAPFETHSSWLRPVRRRGAPAMLKVSFEEEERRGAHLMRWWRGEGAARVLRHEGDAILLERAVGAGSLADMARQGEDDEASRIICAAAAGLHAPRATPTPELVPLARWFRALDPAATRNGGILARAAAAAHELLREPRDVGVLHGDLHHGNVLDFGTRGWLAVDPKGLVGELGFDFANIFCNPDPETALAPGRVARQASVVAEAAGLDRTRLLEWILAYAGLSAAWSLEEGDEPTTALAVAEIAGAEIARVSRSETWRTNRPAGHEGEK
jgi:streptomycin 6-kinase